MVLWMYVRMYSRMELHMQKKLRKLNSQEVTQKSWKKTQYIQRSKEKKVLKTWKRRQKCAKKIWGKEDQKHCTKCVRNWSVQIDLSTVFLIYKMKRQKEKLKQQKQQEVPQVQLCRCNFAGVEARWSTWRQSCSDAFEVGECSRGLLNVGQFAEGLPALRLDCLGRVDPHQVGQLWEELPPLQPRTSKKREREERIDFVINSFPKRTTLCVLSQRIHREKN